MVKKIICIGVALILIFLLISCSHDKTDNKDLEIGQDLIELQIRQDFLSDLHAIGETNLELDDIQIVKNFGTYGECVVVKMNRGAYSEVITLIDDVTFNYKDSYPLIVWRNRHFYDLEDAYNNKYLTKSDLILIANIQNKESQSTEFILTDYKTVLEITVGNNKLLFYSWYTEDMIYTYQLIDEDEKDNEIYQAKIDEEWYLYEQNNFEYWTRSLTMNPYDDELDIKQEDFYLDSDSYYAIKPEKMEYYSNMFNDFEDVDISGIRVKFNDNELPVEMLISIYYSEYDTYADGKMTFEYNTGETFTLPAQYVPSYNIKITTVSNYSSTVNNCWVLDNVAYSFSLKNDSGIAESRSLEIDAYGTFIDANWYNNSWNYNNMDMPYSTGFIMINAMKLIDFEDFVQEEENLVLIASKLNEYSRIILPTANPDTVFLSDLRIKVFNGKIIEMKYTDYCIELPEKETYTTTLTFEYDVLTFEDFQ